MNRVTWVRTTIGITFLASLPGCATARVSESPAEAEPSSAEPDSSQRARPAQREPSLADAPVFTPFTVAPEILNREDIVRALEREYPPLLRGAGVSGTVRVYFFIDEDGTVRNRQIDVSSGHQALDDAAMVVARVYRFSPALNQGEKVPAWVSFGITFQVR